MRVKIGFKPTFINRNKVNKHFSFKMLSPNFLQVFAVMLAKLMAV